MQSTITSCEIPAVKATSAYAPRRLTVVLGTDVLLDGNGHWYDHGINELLEWAGLRTDSKGNLEWPNIVVVDPDMTSRDVLGDRACFWQAWAECYAFDRMPYTRVSAIRERLHGPRDQAFIHRPVAPHEDDILYSYRSINFYLKEFWNGYNTSASRDPWLYNRNAWHYIIASAFGANDYTQWFAPGALNKNIFDRFAAGDTKVVANSFGSPIQEVCFLRWENGLEVRVFQVPHVERFGM